MERSIKYYIILIILIFLEFPIVLVTYFILSIMYVLYSIIEIILRPFKILYEKLFW